ncbi:MAG TPA: hypothetical protein VJR02_01220 [Pyrinomonadaceae bacterium]|nr:hypothetical protein [Pyrinomonadaceae bacterium]
MKRCPVCGKIYGFESLRFCRFDGSRLVDASACEAPTILLNPHELPQKTGGLLVESVTGEHKIHRFT